MTERQGPPSAPRIEGAVVLPLPVGAQDELGALALLTRRTHQLRRAEQHAHAERARRHELEAQLAQGPRLKDALREALGAVGAREQRVRELEEDLERAQRVADEAAHLAAARRRRQPVEPARISMLEETLQRERRRAAEAEARAARLERELAEQRARTARVRGAIVELRAELSRLIVGTDGEALPPSGSSGIEPQRLGEALLRLREAHRTHEAPTASTRPGGAPAHSRTRWLGNVFRSLTAREPEAAGHLLLALLPAGAVVDPRPAAYDLVLSPGAKTVRVTIVFGSVHIAVRDRPRPRSDVDFQLVGDPASIARLLCAGRVRRRLGLGVARIRGQRARITTLRSLLEAPLTLGELHGAGVRLDPALAFKVAALMIDPGWTAGERFTIAHQTSDGSAPDAFLEIRAGAAPHAGGSQPTESVTSALVCPTDALLEALAVGAPSERFGRGELRPLELLGRWLERAQSG